jgi:formylglycine-generating enzyme required for sulfatase activity
MRALGRIATLGAAALLGAACAMEPVTLPPFAEVKIVVDTDLDVGAFVPTLQLDLYDASETWFFSREIQREDPRVWPVSFVLTGPKADDPGAQVTEVLVRLRLYPDGKVRDYRGERFFPEGYLDAAPAGACLPLLPEGYGERQAKALVQRSETGEPMPGFSPFNEPLPDLAIDRLVPVRIVPGKQGEIRVRLTGDCLGKQAGFGGSTGPGDEVVCRNGAYETPDVREPELPDPAASASVVGSFPGARPCTAPPRVGGFDSFEDEVCVPGGLFILGDPAVFAYGQFDAVPEQIAIVPALRVDRFEVTVGRFRKALEGGLLEGVALPIVNDGGLDLTSADATRHCTFTSKPHNFERHPLNCVSWQTARAFCKAMGGDLPTETQWEYVAAASGRSGRETRYPWGSEEPSCTRAVFARARSVAEGATGCAVDQADRGPQALRENEAETGDVTPTGVVGMAGNVREFTLDDYRPYCSRCWFDAPLDDPRCADEPTTSRTVRGGDWAGNEDALLAGLRNEGLAPEAWSTRVGFRCVRRGDTDE